MEVDRFRAFSHASVMRPKPGDQGKKPLLSRGKGVSTGSALVFLGRQSSRSRIARNLVVSHR